MASPWGRGALPSSARCLVAVLAAEVTSQDGQRGCMRHCAPWGAPHAGCGLWLSCKCSRCRSPAHPAPSRTTAWDCFNHTLVITVLISVDLASKLISSLLRPLGLFDL